jgi:hypothetical protein
VHRALQPFFYLVLKKHNKNTICRAADCCTAIVERLDESPIVHKLLFICADTERTHSACKNIQSVANAQPKGPQIR